MHLAKLKNAWQEMWANAANRDTLNFFIDLGTAILKLVNTVGVLPSTFALLLPYLEIFKRGKDGKGLVTSFLEWANSLNQVREMTEALGEVTATEGEVEIATDTATTATTEMKTAADKAQTEAALELAEANEYVNYTEAMETTADLESAAASATKAAASQAEAASKKLGEELPKTAGKTSLLSGAFKGLVTAIGPVPIAIGAVVAALALLHKAYKVYEENQFSKAKEATQSIKQQQDTLSAQIDSYKELKAQLDSGDLSEEETLEVKQQILDIQKQISNEYGSAAKGVDLVNGKLEKQVSILNSISEKDADEQYGRNYKGFQVANKEYNKARQYTIGLPNSFNKELNEQIQNTLSESGLKFISSNSDYFDPSKAGVFKNAADSIDTLQKARDSLEELKKEYRDSKDIETIDKQISELDAQIGKAYEVIDKYEETAFKGMELELARNHRSGYDIFQNYQTSISDLESAYISGNTKQIEEARKAFDEANMAKLRFLTLDNNNQFAPLFDNIDASFVEAKNQYHDVVESFKDIPEPKDLPVLFEEDGSKVFKKNTKALNQEKGALDKARKAAETLYKLNPDRVDIEGTLLDNAYAGDKFADALNDLISELNWSTDNTDDLISALIDAGIVQGNAADIANYASNSYNNFTSSVDEAIVSVGALNTALAESASGKGITDPNLEAFRKAFGEDGLKILEKTANGYHLNTEGAYLLRNAQDALVKADYASALNEQYTALDKLQEGYQKALLAGEDTTGFVQQRQAIQNNIDKINEELMAYQNANSAYQTWLANQNSEGEREMYNSVYSGYDAVKDELDRGFAGAKTRSWLDLIFNDEGEEDFDVWTASAEELRDRFKEVKKDIEGTGGYSIADFFTVDKNGKSTSQGIWNFFEAIENKQDEVLEEGQEKFVDLENGIFNFGKNGDYQIADLLGMDVESVQAILRAATEAGFEIHLDQPLFSMEQLEEKADSAKKSLEEMTGKKLKIDLDPSSVEEADESMKLLSEYQQSIIEDNSIEPKIKTEKLEDVASLMELIAARKRELLEKELVAFKVDDSELEESKNAIINTLNKLSSYTKEKGNIKLGDLMSVDPHLINNVDYLHNLMNEIEQTKTTPNIDPTQIEYLNNLLDIVQNRINLLENGSISPNVTVDQLMAAEQIVNDINTKLDYASQRKINIDWDADEDFIEELNTLANLPEEAKIALNIPTDANGEELLKLAQQGNLHIGVTVDNAPQNTATQTTNNEINTVVTVSGTEDLQQIETYISEIDGTEIKIPFSSNADELIAKEEKIIDNAEEFATTTYEGTAKLNDTDPVNKFSNLFAKAGAWGATDETANMHLEDNGAFGRISNALTDTRNLEGTHTITFKYETIGSPPSGTHIANGTAHVRGTAFAKGSIISGQAYQSGKWGIDKNQTALVGELGTELVVRDGNWYTVGDNGAEFAQLQRGDIVFNHKQAEELFKNGYVTSNGGRGHLVGFANGTAYSRGSSNGAIKPTVSSKGMGGSTKGGSGKGGNGGNGGSNKGKSNKDNAKETKNTLDEVEILIARIERQISRLDSTIGNTYTTWSKRNQAISRSLGKVTEEIEDQKGAYNTYINKANSIGLSETWIKKIQNGKLAIEDVNDSDAWDKIQKYKEYYEKALAAQDKLLELEQKQGELYKQRFDNEQAYYEANIEQIQHVIDLNGAYIDKLSEAGYLISKSFASTQAYKEKQRLAELNKEYDKLRKVRDNAVKTGTIKKGSEAWNEMTSAINEVSSAIEEAEQNIISFTNAMKEVDWNRWDKTHEAISGIVNELEFLYDLIDEDKMFDETGAITNYGVTAYALLAQQYDTYIAQANEYAKQRKQLEEELEKDQYNQTLVDELKETIEAEQDAISSAKKLKDSIVDVTENGYKKQIDYIKDLIDDYEELLEAQKDQIDYAKKVADQQKEINKLEKQYRAIQNDTSEEGATKRQKLQAQIKEKKEALQETQEDRRISETKDMLSDFEESFEDFLNNKLKDVETTFKDGINIANNNIDAVKDTINDLAKSNGYTVSDTLKNSLINIKDTLVSYFENGYNSEIANNTSTIVEGVNAIVNYYKEAQSVSEEKAKAERISTKIRETGTHVQSYKNEKGQTVNGYFNDDGTLNTKFNGWVNNKTNYYKNGQQVTNAWQTINGKKYYFNKSGTKVTGSKTIGGKKYYFDKDGTMLTGWRKVGGKLHYYNPYMYTGKQTIGGQKYTFDDKGVFVKKGWKKGTSFVPKTGYAWTNEGNKAEAIIRKSDGAILTPLNRGDSVIPSNAMKNMYQALTNPEKYLKQYTTPDIKVIQTSNGNNNSSPANINMQFIANGVQDANKFVNDLMNNKKLEKWIQEVTLGQANGNNSFRKYSYAIR